MAKKLTLAEMRKLAKSKGGKCLSKKYVNAKTKLKWKCKEGHEWNATPVNIKKDSWCPVCGHIRGGYAQRATIKEIREIAKARGGKCLSRKYVGDRAKLKWECERGHIWEAIPGHIKRGSWCPFCSRVAKLTIEEMQYLASERGGKCLSKKYINNLAKLKWRCKEGHMWEATPSSIKRGSWCPFCSHRVKLTIEEMQSIARDRGGECLSKKFVNSYAKLRWRCKGGHRWKATPKSIKKGNWCSVCANQRKTIEDMQKLAEERGGECLTEKYVNINSKFKWKCKEGHAWKAKPSYIKIGHWCPICSRIKRVDTLLEETKDLAKSRGGECLSKKFVDYQTKLRFQCKEGHMWKTTPGIIKSGSWCPECSYIKIRDAKRLYFEKFKEIAKERGGRCLSKEYVNKDMKLQWECKEGHIWHTTPSVVREGSWCPICAGRGKTIGDMQKLAEKRGGECLSEVYINSYTKLRWRCKKGHIWKATPNSIKQGSWCSVCAREKKVKEK